MLELLSTVLSLSITVFAVSSMVSVGLTYKLADLVAPLRDFGAVARAVTVNFVLIPLLVWVIIRVLPLGQANETALIILACAAGAPVIVKLTQIAGGDVAKSATLLLLMLPLTIVFMSIVLPLAVPGTTISWTAVATPLVQSMLLPLAIGLVFRALLPDVAARLKPWSGKAANITLTILIVLGLALNFRLVLGMFGTGAILAAVLLIGGSLLFGWLLGGPDREERITLAFGSAQRNFAAAMVTAREFEDPQVLTMVVVVSTISNLLVPLARWVRRREPKPAESTDEARRGRGRAA
jgi:BASS family bile acid:Na+ symporter